MENVETDYDVVRRVRIITVMCSEGTLEIEQWRKEETLALVAGGKRVTLVLEQLEWLEAVFAGTREGLRAGEEFGLVGSEHSMVTLSVRGLSRSIETHSDTFHLLAGLFTGALLKAKDQRLIDDHARIGEGR